MDWYEYTTTSFIVKVWVEGDDEQNHRHWRGHITHVFSGKRQYFEDLAVIGDFIAPYLTAIGATPREAEEQSEGAY